MSKPVTELYEEAEEAAGALTSEAADDLGRHHRGHALLSRIGVLDKAAGGGGTPRLLEVLDLVATLPPERLRLVRWAAGLTAEPLGEVQGLLEMGTAEAKKRGYPDWEKGVAYGSEFMRAALSGGEGGAKDEDTKHREPGCQCHIEEGDSPCRVHGEEADEPTPTILPAGKPPPFIRVGMVLAGKRDHSWTVEAMLRNESAVLRGGGEVRVRSIKDLLAQCVLAEPFTVEGKS